MAQEAERDLEAAAAPARILVLEDEPLLARLLESTLSRSGYLVEVAAAPMEAERRWHRLDHDVDLVVAERTLAGGRSGVDAVTRVAAGGAGAPAHRSGTDTLRRGLRRGPQRESPCSPDPSSLPTCWLACAKRSAIAAAPVAIPDLQICRPRARLGWVEEASRTSRSLKGGGPRYERHGSANDGDGPVPP